MLNMVIQTPNTGDGFNPILVGAIGAACLVVLIFLAFSGRRK